MTAGGLPSTSAGYTTSRWPEEVVLQVSVLVAGITLLAFGVKLLTDYQTADQAAVAYHQAPQCVMPSAVPTSSCYSVVIATVTQVLRSSLRYGSGYRLDLQLPTGSQSIWLAAAPPPIKGTPVGAKVWRGRVTLISAPDRLIETTENPLWQKGDSLLHAILILGLSVGLLLFLAVRPRGTPRAVIEYVRWLESRVRESSPPAKDVHDDVGGSR